MFDSVKNGIDGFDVKYENGFYVAVPEKSMRSENLKQIANSNNILVKDGLIPYFPGDVSWNAYRLSSQMIFYLMNAIR